jgi:hypothetical protein
MKKLLVGMLALASCSGVQKKVCVDPKSLQCEAVNNLVDCTKPLYGEALVDFGPLIANVISSSTGADGKIDWNQVKNDGIDLSSKYTACVVVEEIADLAAKAEQASSLPTQELRQQFSVLKQTFVGSIHDVWQYKFKVKRADGTVETL